MTTDQSEIDRLSAKVTDNIYKKISGPARMAKGLIAALCAALLAAGGFIWDQSEKKVLDQTHEDGQDARIDENRSMNDANYNAILDLATLHIAQGRFVEKQFKRIAPEGTIFEDRPGELIRAEEKLIMRQRR